MCSSNILLSIYFQHRTSFRFLSNIIQHTIAHGAILGYTKIKHHSKESHAMQKRILSLILCITLLCSMLPVSGAATTLPAEALLLPEETEAPETLSTEAPSLPEETLPPETLPVPETLPLPEANPPAAGESARASAEVKNETYLQELYDEGYRAIDCDVVIENDFLWAEGQRFDLSEGCTVTVSGGATLTLDDNSDFRGTVLVKSGGTLIIHDPCILLSTGVLQVEAGGKLQVDGSDGGYISCYYGAVLNVQGTFESQANGRVDMLYRDGVWAQITGIPNACREARCLVFTDAQLREVTAFQESNKFPYFLVSIASDFSLAGDLTVSEGCTVKVDDNATLTIPEGCTLTNYDALSVNNGSIQNNGTLNAYGRLSVTGTFTNNGTVELFGSHISVASGGTFHNNGTVYGNDVRVDGTWTGNDPILRTRNEEYLRQLISSGESRPSMEVDVVLENNFTISGDFTVLNVNATLTVPAGKTLTIQSNTLFVNYGGAIVVEEGGSLILNNGYLSCWNGSRVINRGSLYGTGYIIAHYENGQYVTEVQGIPYDLLRLRFLVNNDADLQNAMRILGSTDYIFYILLVHGDVTLSQDLILPENAKLALLDTKSTMVIPSGRTLVNNGIVEIGDIQTFHNQGTVVNNGTFVYRGTVINDGVFHAGNSLLHYGTWQGNAPIRASMTQSEFEALLAAGGTVTLDTSVTLEKNLTIPDTVALTISGGNIVVPKGLVLTVNTGVTLYNGGITVAEGGKLNLNSMIFLHANGVLQVDGTFRSGGEGMEVVRFYDNGLTPCTVTGVPEANQRLYVILRDQSQYWTTGIEVFESEAYRNFGRVFLDIVSDVTLPGDLTIPENGILIIEGTATNLTVPQGMTLINHGVLRIDEAKSLYNYGTIKNHGYFYIRANLFNYGNVEMLPPEAGSSWESLMDMVQYGYVQNNGQVTFHTGSRLVQHETSLWTGNDPVWEFITQDQLEAEMAAAEAQGETYTLTTGVTLERNLTLDMPLNIGSGGSLLVPKGVTLNLKALLNVFAGGRLEVQGKYTATGGGQVGIRYENGSFSSQAIGIANKDLWVNMWVRSDAQLRDGVALMETGGYGLGSLAISDSFTLEADITIPSNTIIPIENGAYLTIPAGCTLEINGEVYIWPGQTLENNGRIRNNNLLRIGDGTLINNGTLELTAAEKQHALAPRLIVNPGVMENNGTVTLAKNSYMELYGLWYGNVPQNSGGRILPQAQSLTIEGGENRVVDLRQTSSITLQVTQPGASFRDAVWTSDNPAVVDASQITHQGGGVYHVPILGLGKVRLTATSIDGANRTDFVILEAERADWSPRLGSTSLSLNPQLEGGATVPLIPSYGNEILSCRLEDTRFTAEYNAAAGTLTVNTVGELKNGSVSTVLYLRCADGETYPYQLKITVKNNAPAVTVKQAKKMDLFYTDSAAALTVTAKSGTVTALELTDTADFCLDDGILQFSEQFVADCLENPQLKPDTKATLLVYLEGYRFPVAKSLTISTTTSKVSLTTDPSSSTVHSALGSDLTAALRILNKSTKLPLELEDRHIQSVEAAFVSGFRTEDGTLTLDITGETGGTASIALRMDNWMKAVKVSHKVTVNTKLPTAKAKVSTLKLSTVFPRQTAETPVTLSHSNLDITFFSDFVSTAKEGSAARQEADKLQLLYDGSNIVARIPDPNNLPKAGNYTFTAVPTVADTDLKALTVKVNVSSTLPKVKLGSSKLKLNTLLAGGETGSIPVTLTDSTGYDLQLTGFLGMDTYSQIHMELEEDTLQVRLSSQRVGSYPFTLIPVVSDDTGTSVELAPLKLTLQTYEKEVTVAQSGKGSLDAIDRSSRILYTVGKIANALGTVDAVELVSGGEWFALSPLETDAKGKQTFALSLKEDAAVSTKETYPVQLKYWICGRPVLSKTLQLKVKQSALKVSAPAVTYYLSQQTPLAVRISPSSPAGAAIAGVSILPTKTDKALLDAIGSVEPVWGDGVVMNLEIRYPGNLTPGKSYKLVLDITPAGHAAGAKTTQVTVTVKVAK